MEDEIICYLSLDQDLYHASHIYTGLCELEEEKRARVKFVVPQGEDEIYASDSLTVCLSVRNSKTDRRDLLAIDLRDRSDLLTDRLLERCDLYLKRSYYEPDLLQLSPGLKQKVVPYGLNYACRTRRSTKRVLSALARHMGADLFHSPKRVVGQLNPRRSILYQYLTTALARDFEQGPEIDLEPTVLFQTRVYEPEEIYPDDPSEVNEERVRLVRALREAFGARFTGGLVPTAYAKEHYPDAVSDQPTRQSQYVALSKSSLVAIYTRGLCHSLAFKLPEYLAASKCIVSGELRNQLPVPLTEGLHYLGFRTPEECVERCGKLLEDRELANRLRREAWRYYQEEVKPVAHLSNCLGRISPYVYSND